MCYSVVIKDTNQNNPVYGSALGEEELQELVYSLLFCYYREVLRAADFIKI